MLRYLMADLAKKIAKDGEGATKLIEVNVRHAKDEQSGRMIARVLLALAWSKQLFWPRSQLGTYLKRPIGYARADVSVDNIDI